MFILNIKYQDKTNLNIEFHSRAQAQEDVNKLYLGRRIDVKEWRRLGDILSEPGVENSE